MLLAPSRMGGPLVLVVDDEPSIRETIGFILEMEGFRVATAEDGTDIRENLFRALASSNLPILQMGPMDLSLEEIFLNLTTDEEQS